MWYKSFKFFPYSSHFPLINSHRFILKLKKQHGWCNHNDYKRKAIVNISLLSVKKLLLCATQSFSDINQCCTLEKSISEYQQYNNSPRIHSPKSISPWKTSLTSYPRPMSIPKSLNIIVNMAPIIFMWIKYVCLPVLPLIEQYTISVYYFKKGSYC